MRHGRSPAGADPNAFKATGKEDEAMELANNTALLIVGFIFLIKGADFFVEGASGFARKSCRACPSQPTIWKAMK